MKTACFRHRPQKKIPMWRRPDAVPPGWRVVDFGGPGKSGRELPGLSTRRMELLRLVLDAGGIPFMIRGHGTQARAWVPALYETLARGELAEVAAEGSARMQPAPRRRNAHWMMFALLLLILWHGLRMGWWSTPFDAPGPEAWLRAGRLDSTAMAAGEWWRAATALTLHKDSLHLFSNVVFSAPFLILLAQRTGLGTTLLSVTASGMLANACDALYRGPGWHSIGFSTGMFAAVGLLCARTPVQGAGNRLLRCTAIPLAAALAFLALLGTEGEDTDYAAHILGLASGLAAGLLTRAVRRHDAPSPPRIEFLLGTAALLLTAFCWALAL